MSEKKPTRPPYQPPRPSPKPPPKPTPLPERRDTPSKPGRKIEEPSRPWPRG
ncbi:MAG: hypothetical protein KAW56_09305 [Candidatus Marinimicrobia bacterium]|nr:hypothetical protein [Candidatus Neomarinimicrobiota bacterium]